MPLPPDEPNDEERLEELPEDGQTPFSPADPERNDEVRDSDGPAEPARLDDTHPDTDSDIEGEDVYEEGIAGAAGVSEPNAGNTVVSYDETKDRRRKGKNA